MLKLTTACVGEIQEFPQLGQPVGAGPPTTRLKASGSAKLRRMPQRTGPSESSKLPPTAWLSPYTREMLQPRIGTLRLRGVLHLGPRKSPPCTSVSDKTGLDVPHSGMATREMSQRGLGALLFRGVLHLGPGERPTLLPLPPSPVRTKVRHNCRT